jgi:hypothetical protein
LCKKLKVTRNIEEKNVGTFLKNVGAFLVKNS